MSYILKKLPEGLIQIDVEVPLEDMKRPLMSAAVRLSEKKPLEGFRPGKAPYDIVKARFGEAAIYEEASSEIIKRSYMEALKEEDLTTVAAPEIQPTQVVPGLPFKYTAKVAVLPETKIGDISKIKVKKQVKEVTPADIEKVLKDIQRLRASSSAVERPAALKDKLSVSIQMFLDKIPLDGGQARKQDVILGEDFYVPGFSEALVGVKRGETKEFTIEYPKNAQEKNLAGRQVEFKVEVHEVFEVKLPELNDDFAKTIGKFESFQDLQNKIKENVGLEYKSEADRRSESELLEKLVAVSQFSDLPAVLVDGELERMLEELGQDLVRQGLERSAYLQHLKKTEEQFRKELRPQAERRLKVALLLRTLGKEQGLAPSTEEIDQYFQGWAGHSKDDPQVAERIKDQTFRDYAANILANQKTLEYLKKQCIV